MEEELSPVRFETFIKTHKTQVTVLLQTLPVVVLHRFEWRLYRGLTTVSRLFPCMLYNMTYETESEVMAALSERRPFMCLKSDKLDLFLSRIMLSKRGCDPDGK